MIKQSQINERGVDVRTCPLALGSDKVGQSGDGVVSLLQLPHVDEKVATNLNRKKCRSIGDLMAECAVYSPKHGPSLNSSV